MKKLLIAILIIFFAAISGPYVLIPNRIRISSISLAPCIQKNVSTCLQDLQKWKQWWPVNSFNLTDPDNFFSYKKSNYKLNTPYTDGADIDLVNHEIIHTRIMIIPQGKDSCSIEWRAVLTTSFNPFRRIKQYFEAAKIKDNLHDLSDNLVTFASKTENIYGFHIERTTFTDVTLAATRFSTNKYPSTETVYQAVDQLRKKIKDEAAEEKDFPMLNVQELDSSHFETMIAICINKEIPTAGNIFISRMVPMKDRFLKTDVTGGLATIKNAHKAIENYMNDRFLSAPAISFEIMVTDREKQADTTLWKTAVFYPSM